MVLGLLDKAPVFVWAGARPLCFAAAAAAAAARRAEQRPAPGAGAWGAVCSIPEGLCTQMTYVFYLGLVCVIMSSWGSEMSVDMVTHHGSDNDTSDSKDFTLK